jgi:glycosyltransferase involved in cell wall biosynthesis
MKIVNLLDDFNLGGVTKGLSIFDEPEIRAVASVSTIAVQPDQIRADFFDADLLLTHFPPNWRRLPYIMSLKRRNPHARIVHIEHSYGEYWFHRNVPNPARFKTMLSLALGQFDAVVNVSDAQRIWMTQLTSLPTNMFRTIYPYSSNPAVDALAPPTFAKNRPLTIGAYGRLHECKGFDRLITAFKAIGPDRGLQLAIGGDGPQETALKAMAEGAPHIRFAGFVDDIAGFLEACHVIAVPSRYETFGQVALESRRAARPLLVSDIDGLPEQVSDCGLIVDCSNQHVLQSALMLFKILPLKHMSRMARASAQGAREKSIDGWLSLIQGRGEERSDLRHQSVS